MPSALLMHPTLPVVPNSGWGHEALVSPRLAFVWHRFKSLRALNMTAPKVVKEFLQCRIAPLQRHSRPMWALTGYQDRMWLQDTELAPETLKKVVEVLTGDPSPGDIRHGAASCIFARAGPSSRGRCLTSTNGGCALLASWGLARIPSSWLPSLLPTPILPQEGVQGGKHHWGQGDLVLRC